MTNKSFIRARTYHVALNNQTPFFALFGPSALAPNFMPIFPDGAPSQERDFILSTTMLCGGSV
jgi:hypothetical protein